VKAQANAAFDWMFRSRETGRIVVAQIPNVSLGLFLAATGLRGVLPTRWGVTTGVRWFAVPMLAWWGLDEIVRGVNPWRRLLGAFGVASVVGSVVALLQ
jgi:hypothetical protein